MSQVKLFLLIEVGIFLLPAIFMFKGLRSFLKCLYHYLTRQFFVFSKKEWSQRFDKSVKMDGYLFIVMGLTVINVLIFRFII